jgi:hypothetical protein
MKKEDFNFCALIATGLSAGLTEKTMRVTTKISWDMNTGAVLEHEYFEYSGPVALCDRSAVQASKNARDVAGSTAAQAGGEADTEHGMLAPFAMNEMKATHLYSPQDMNELLTAGEAPIGAVAGDTAHKAELESARTRNASGFSKDLDQANRDKMKAAAGISEGIAGEDVMGAKKLNQEGAGLMSDLFKSDQQKQLEAMGLQTQDINAQTNAGKSGWLQNMNDTIKAVGSLGGASKGPMAYV